MAGQVEEGVDQWRPGRVVLGGLADLPQGEVEVVEASGGQEVAGKCHGLGPVEPETLHGEPQAHLEVGPGHRADGLDHLVQHAGAAGGVPAVAVGAVVAHHVEELPQDVPVRPVHLDAVETRPLAPRRRRGEVGDQLFDLAGGEGARTRAGVVERGDRRLTRGRGVRPDAAVVQLYRRDRPGGAQAVGQPGQAGQVVVGRHPELAGPGQPRALHVGGRGDDQAESAAGAGGQPADLVVGERAVGVALGVGQGRQRETVAQGGPAAQGERFVERGHALIDTTACITADGLTGNTRGGPTLTLVTREGVRHPTRR